VFTFLIGIICLATLDSFCVKENNKSKGFETFDNHQPTMYPICNKYIAHLDSVHVGRWVA